MEPINWFLKKQKKKKKKKEQNSIGNKKKSESWKIKINCSENFRECKIVQKVLEKLS